MSAVKRSSMVFSCCAIVSMVMLGLSGCGSDSNDGASSSTTRSAVLSVDDGLFARLPQRVRATKQLIIGTDATFEPIIVSHDGKFVGFDADVAAALGQILGVTPVFRAAEFSTLIEGVKSGTYDTAMRGIFDTLARESEVDMVSYFSAGTQWAQEAGKKVDPNNACGLRVGVSAGTVQGSVEIPAKSKACTTVGENAITAVPFASVAQAAAALEESKVDALSADSPVTAFAVHGSKGKLSLAGDIFDTDPYALPVAKGSSLGPALRGGVQRLIDSGELERVARKWGIEDGMIRQSTINTAIS